MKTILQIITLLVSVLFFAQTEEKGVVDLGPNQKEINQRQDRQRNYLLNFLDATYEKRDGIYLLTEKETKEGQTLEISDLPTFTGKDLEEIKIIQNGKFRPFLEIYFKPRAQHYFSHLISKNAGNGFATIVDKKIIMMTPVEKEMSKRYIRVIGLYDFEQVNKLKS